MPFEFQASKLVPPSITASESKRRPLATSDREIGEGVGGGAEVWVLSVGVGDMAKQLTVSWMLAGV